MTDLKAPIPGDDPFGIFLKGDKAAYRALRNAFNAGQTAFRALSETPDSLLDADLQAANTEAWGALEEAAGGVLEEKSKDLEIMSWYLASLIQKPNPLPDTGATFGAMTDLIEESWSELQPIPPDEKLKGESDEDKAREIADIKLRPFVQLFGEVEGGGLLHIPLTNLPLAGAISYAGFLAAEKAGEMDDLRSAFRDAVDANAETITERIETLQAMRASGDRLNGLLSKIASGAGMPPPNTGYFNRLLDGLLKAMREASAGSGLPWPGEVEEAEAVPDDAASPAAESGGATGGRGGSFNASFAGQNREAALASIAELAKFFRKSEPHSPIHLLLDRAVRWGNLSMQDLYSEILSEGSQGMAQMTLMTGLESAGFSDRYSGKPMVAARAEMPDVGDATRIVPKPAAPSEPSEAAAEPSNSEPDAPAEPDEGEELKFNKDFEW